MQFGDLRNQIRQCAIVEQHFGRHGKARLPACLGSHHRPHLGFGQAIAGTHPREADFIVAIDHQNAVAEIQVGASLDQQGHGENRVDRPRGPAAFSSANPDQGVEDGFQALSGRGIGKNQKPHGGSVQTAFYQAKPLVYQRVRSEKGADIEQSPQVLATKPDWNMRLVTAR